MIARLKSTALLAKPAAVLALLLALSAFLHVSLHVHSHDEESCSHHHDCPVCTALSDVTSDFSPAIVIRTLPQSAPAPSTPGICSERQAQVALAPARAPPRLKPL